MLLVLTFSSFPSWAANSFIMNRHTPTCDKYLDEKNRPTNMSDKELEYRSLRISLSPQVRSECPVKTGPVQVVY